MSLKDDWKAMKKTFEDATGKKKPSAKLNSFFHQSTGIEPAVDKIDKAKTKAECKTAIGGFVTKKTEYIKILKQHQVDADSNNVNYKVEIDKFIMAIEGLEHDCAEKMMKMPG
jgi:hypothetical protein